MFESCRAHHTIYYNSIIYGGLGPSAFLRPLRGMPRKMPTLSFSRPRHGLECVLLLGMNIMSGGPDIAVASQILERKDIHVGRPTGQARVPKGVRVEGLDLRQPTSLCVLFLETRRLDVPTSGRSGNNHEEPSRLRSRTLMMASSRGVIGILRTAFSVFPRGI